MESRSVFILELILIFVCIAMALATNAMMDARKDMLEVKKDYETKVVECRKLLAQLQRD